MYGMTASTAVPGRRITSAMVAPRRYNLTARVAVPVRYITSTTAALQMYNLISTGCGSGGGEPEAGCERKQDYYKKLSADLLSSRPWALDLVLVPIYSGLIDYANQKLTEKYVSG